MPRAHNPWPSRRGARMLPKTNDMALLKRADQQAAPRSVVASAAIDLSAVYAATVSAASTRRGSSVSRAITRRWICEVPSYSCMIFASRNSFSTG